MGIAFIAAKAEKFDQQTDDAFREQFESGNLFSALPDSTSQTFRCRACVSELPPVGAGVLLYNSGNGVHVFLQNVQTGSVKKQDAVELVGIMEKLQTEALPAQVTEQQPLSGGFVVRLVTGEN
ncbi:MAG: hypothetical protein QM813_03395 [Verrucomicrobiota bacterium]